VLRASVDRRAFPGASAEVGNATRPVWQYQTGALTYDAGAGAVAPDTIYDLASLTKVLATASVAARSVEYGRIGLDDRVCEHVALWTGADRLDVTLRDLLSHASGLPGHAPLFRQIAGREAFESRIAETAQAYAPRSQSVYSDLGFILLGFVLAGGGSLREPFDALWTLIGGGDELTFTPPPTWRPRTAPTEMDPWRGRLLVGEVHDENCHALGGVAGHAGLFGTASAVGTFARHLLQILDGRQGVFSQALLREFIARRQGIPGSSRALGWDTMVPTSSCGTRMSPDAFGHTGFTGTTLWIDPVAGCYAVLLTNRVHPSRENDAIAAIRPAFHDAAMVALGF
jgi:CubicO group peptidase (beta-lactamase class C family)